MRGAKVQASTVVRSGVEVHAARAARARGELLEVVNSFEHLYSHRTKVHRMSHMSHHHLR